MKKIIILLVLAVKIPAFSQTIDTVITTPVFKSYVSKTLRLPVMVSYKLYKGGGNCNRLGLTFHNSYKVNVVGAKEFKASGYDEGHLANAEDFANNCIKQTQTFEFINQLPQTPNLNRGIWKHWETTIRNESQTDSLFIICGGIWEDKKVVNNIYIPNKNWKIVYSLTTRKVLHVLLFTNSDEATCKEITLEELEKEVKFKIETL